MKMSLIVQVGRGVYVSVNEHTASAIREPVRETFPATELVCENLAVVDGFLGDLDCDRAAGTVRRRFSAPQTKAIGL